MQFYVCRLFLHSQQFQPFFNLLNFMFKSPHNPKVVSSSLTPATNFEALSLFFCFLIFILICKIPWRQVSYRKNLLIVFPSSSNLAVNVKNFCSFLAKKYVGFWQRYLEGEHPSFIPLFL